MEVVYVELHVGHGVDDSLDHGNGHEIAPYIVGKPADGEVRPVGDGTKSQGCFSIAPDDELFQGFHAVKEPSDMGGPDGDPLFRSLDMVGFFRYFRGSHMLP